MHSLKNNCWDGVLVLMLFRCLLTVNVCSVDRGGLQLSSCAFPRASTVVHLVYNYNYTKCTTEEENMARVQNCPDITLSLLVGIELPGQVKRGNKKVQQNQQ